MNKNAQRVTKKENKVYLGTLDRFGYELTVIGFSEQECIDELMKVYEKQYRNEHNSDPRKDERYSDGSSYYDNAVEDILIREMVSGQVEWF